MASVRARKTAHGKSFQVRGPGIASRTFTVRADAKLYASEAERKRRLGEYYEAPAESFGAFLDAFLARKRPGWRDSTYRDRLQLKTYLKPLEGLNLKDVDRAGVEDVVASVASHAPRRAQKALALVKAVLQDA